MYHLTSLVVVLIFLISDVHSATDRGAITVSGATGTRIAGGNCGVTVSGSTVKLAQNCAPRVYLMKDSWNVYKFGNLMGKTIKFTTNIASAGCGCNAAVYFIEYPDNNNSPDYYCDAQCPSGKCCNEIDLFEANTHALAVTAHCNAGDNPCKWGCGVNWKSANGYGVNGKINTASDFTTEVSFVGSSTLTAMKIKVSQGSNVLTHSLTDSSCSGMKSGYISGLTSAVTRGNLVMAISFWGGDMNWLDGCSAGGSCPGSALAYFKSIQIIKGVTALEEDTTGTGSESGFVGTPGFYAVIGICVLLALIVVVAIVVIHKKRNLPESV